MLVLGRKRGESLVIYDAATGEWLGEIVLTHDCRSEVRVGIRGDRLRVLREEIAADAAGEAK